jgi:hypothetical protein
VQELGTGAQPAHLIAGQRPDLRHSSGV